MKLDASAGRNPRASVFDHCERLKLVADSEQDAKVLAAFIRVYQGRSAVRFTRNETGDIVFEETTP